MAFLQHIKITSGTEGIVRTNQNREIGHLCYMKPLKNEMAFSDTIIYVFYEFETTQNTKCSEKATVHVPNLVCVQQFCSRYENMEGIHLECAQCGKRIHALWEDPVGDLL